MDLVGRTAAESLIGDVLSTAAGRSGRDDAVRGRAGGPAGNARLTAWTGLLLLVLLAVEGLTLLAIGSLLGLHIVVGVLLVPVVLLKSATTGWRVLRYYRGDRDYVRAGPPPTLLRVLGPLVVASTLAVLATGIALVVMGAGGVTASVDVGGTPLSMVTLHKASFFAWFALMTLHVLARTVPALRTLAGTQERARPVPGGAGRLGLLALSVMSGAVLSVVLLGAASWWTTSWTH